MGATERVPNELWLEVLKNVSEYDPTTLSSFSFTCRALNRVSRPLVFSQFNFTPYLVTSKDELRLPSSTTIDRLLERLAFWSSADIAPFVRYCNIRALCAKWSWGAGTNEKAEWSVSTDSPHILLDALFECLAQFTGLQRLRASHVYFTQAMVDILCRLPVLPFNLGIYWCYVAPGERVNPTQQALRVSKLDIVSEKEREYSDDHWILLLHPEHLRSLRADFDARFMGQTLDAIPSFPNVEELTVTLNLPTPSKNLGILYKFPAVRILKLFGKADGVFPPSRSHTSPIFPRLREYSGQHQPLPMFFPVSTLTHLKISKCSYKGLITTLGEIGGLNSIVSFHTEFSQFTTMAFLAILELLPHLTELAIRIVFKSTHSMFSRHIYSEEFELKEDEVVHGKYGDGLLADFKPSTFFLALSSISTLPPSLERLAISWECYEEEFWDERVAYRLPKFEQLRDALVVKCPRLTWLYLDGHYFMYQWRITPEGVVKEETATKFLEAYGQRQGAESFWELW
ncbi:hypothetical protein B0H16DRAFT_1764788 [Mycena metata]|uniref:F-box domain-containing protein n=1 Tax=Mycena metata TaxID=1033252 RepID=A0AAD7MWY2_9AGAR|nr:hypothetical protein B0H16DRAFT_1764788 [Mycena metata]